MNKLITVITTALFLVCFSTVVPARADRKTMEGFMLGTGVAILGAAIIHGMNDNDRPPQYARHHSPPSEPCRIGYRDGHYDRGRDRHYNHRADGHWELVKIWVEPIYERKWNPAHYDRRGNWVEGRYEEFQIAEGYYQDQRVWVGR